MNKNTLFVSAILFVLISCSAAFASNYADTFGFSATGISLGNAMTARVNDWSSVYYNMAGLGKTPEGESTAAGDPSMLNQIALNYLYSNPEVEIDISNSLESRWRWIDRPDGSRERQLLSTNGDKDLDTATIIVGLTADLNRVYQMPSFISTARFGLGLGLPDDMSAAKVNDLDPRTHNFLRYGRETEKLVLLAGVGLGFLDDMFGVGVGVNNSFTGEGNVLLENVQISTDPQTPQGQAKMDLKIDPSLLIGLYFQPGKIFPVLEGLELGASYRMKSQLEIDPFDTAAVTGTGGIPLNLKLAIFDYYQPDCITFGVAYSFRKAVVLSVDLEIQEWSDYKVSSAVEGNWAPYLPDLDDIAVPKLGVEYKKSDKTSILFGYYFQPTITPEKAGSGPVNFLDNDKQVLSLGIQYKLPRIAGFKAPITFMAGYQYQILEKRDVTKAYDRDISTAGDLDPDYSHDGVCHSIIAGFTY